MAQRILTVLIDDIDGKELADGAGETVTFALDATTYELDLSKENADKFRTLLQDYTAVARKVGKSTSRSGKRATTSNAKEIRDWARSNGYEVPERGRIPADVREAFESKS